MPGNSLERGRVSRGEYRSGWTSWRTIPILRHAGLESQVTRIDAGLPQTPHSWVALTLFFCLIGDTVWQTGARVLPTLLLPSCEVTAEGMESRRAFGWDSDQGSPSGVQPGDRYHPTSGCVHCDLLVRYPMRFNLLPLAETETLGDC